MPTISLKEFTTRNKDDYYVKDTIRKRVYKSTQWERLRRKKLMDQPLCEVHLLAGKTRLAEHVHHKETFVVPDYALSYRLAFDYANLMSICPSCHAKIHCGMEIEEIVKQLKE